MPEHELKIVNVLINRISIPLVLESWNVKDIYIYIYVYYITNDIIMHITIQQINFLRFFFTQKSVKYLRRVIIRWYTCTYTIFSVWNTASVHRKIMFISSTIFRLNLSKDYIRCQSYVLFITPTAITTSILACLKTNLGEKNWDQWGREAIAYLHEEQFTS